MLRCVMVFCIVTTMGLEGVTVTLFLLTLVLSDRTRSKYNIL